MKESATAQTPLFISDAGLLVERAVLQQDNEKTEFLRITARTS
jgi:hypothetical protein